MAYYTFTANVAVYGSIHLFSVIAYDFLRERRCRGNGIKELFTYFLIALLSSLVCALIEFLLVCLIFRPVSKVL